MNFENDQPEVVVSSSTHEDYGWMVLAAFSTPTIEKEHLSEAIAGILRSGVNYSGLKSWIETVAVSKGYTWVDVQPIFDGLFAAEEYSLGLEIRSIEKYRDAVRGFLHARAGELRTELDVGLIDEETVYDLTVQILDLVQAQLSPDEMRAIIENALRPQ